MPEQKKQDTYSNGETSFKEDNQNKRWKGIKQDPRSGKFIVYITESSERLFDDINSAVDFMVQASYGYAIEKTAGAPEFGGVERGQDNLEGVKQVTIKRKLVLDKATGKWKVKESTRTDMVENDQEAAKNTYTNIEDAKDQAEAVIPVDQYLEEQQEEAKQQQEQKKDTKDKSVEENVEVESALKDFQPVAKCGHCGCAIYPYSISDEAFDRQQLADAFCPACGYGLGEAQPNEQSVDNLVQGYK